jgi:hypothetical protein
MFVTSVAPPVDLQQQSLLVNLPAEIKHSIFGLCLTADDCISDPRTPSDVPGQGVPLVGTAILQTCRRLYHEVDRRPLFSQNTFRFTTVDNARSFLKTLDRHHGESVRDIEIDIRKVDNSLAHDWLRYLAWGNGPWDSTSCSLHILVARPMSSLVILFRVCGNASKHQQMPKLYDGAGQMANCNWKSSPGTIY